MTTAPTSRKRTIAFAVIVAFVGALGLYRWTRPPEPPSVVAPRAAPASRVPASRPEPVPPPRRSAPQVRDTSAASPAPVAAERASPVVSTPPVFDLATLPGSNAAEEERRDEDQFPTAGWLTQEDLQHPEMYFELAEHMPELNRPEERRDTLDFFIAYREKLRRDLETGGEGQDERQTILAALERYDHAIARLRKLIDTAGAQ